MCTSSRFSPGNVWTAYHLLNTLFLTKPFLSPQPKLWLRHCLKTEAVKNTRFVSLLKYFYCKWWRIAFHSIYVAIIKDEVLQTLWVELIWSSLFWNWHLACWILNTVIFTFGEYNFLVYRNWIVVKMLCVTYQKGMGIADNILTLGTL